MNRKGILLLAFILILAVFTACTSNGGNENTANESTNSSSNNANEEGQQDPTPLSLIVQNQTAWPMQEDWLVWELMNEHANVELDVTTYQGNWWDAIPLIIASGEMPDLMWMSGLDMIHRFGADGALVDLYEHIDQMPNLAAWIEQYPEQADFVLSHDGKMFIHPSHGGYVSNSMFLYRQDILDEHNLSLASNYEEFYDLLLELKNIYPDSYPLYAQSTGIINSLSPSFDTWYTFYYNRGRDEWTFGPLDESYFEMIQFMANAYEDGLIPLEFGNLNAQNRDELVYNDRTFFMSGYINWIEMFESNMKEVNPDFTIAIMTPPAGPSGQGYHEYQYMQESGMTVTSTGNVDAAIQFIDSMFSEDAFEFLSWGREGETYEVVDGEKRYLDNVDTIANRSADYGLRTAGTFIWFDDEANQQLLDDVVRPQYVEALDYIAPPLVTPRLTRAEETEISNKREAINSYVSEHISRFIIGQRPLSEWDDFIAGLHNLGVNDVIEIYQTAHDRANP